MYEKLLQELKDYTYFCGWKYETRNGSRTKVPKSVKGHNADNSNLDDFCDCLLYTSPSPRDTR